MTNAHAYSLFGVVSALFYLLPMIGGYAGDKILDPKSCVMIGSIVSMIGYFLLAVPTEAFMYCGLAVLTVGTGLFMPNITSMVSNLYKKDDIRRESGFSIFYTFINIGGIIPPLISAFLIYKFGWTSAFLLAGFAMFISALLSHFDKSNGYAKATLTLHLTKIILILLAMFYVTLLLILLVLAPQFTDEVIFFVSIFIILYLVRRINTYPREEKKRLFVCLLLIGCSVFFEVLYGQAGMSLTLYTEFNTQRTIFGYTIPTIVFRSLNPLFIIILGPLFAKLWLFLSKKNKNPSIPTKFAYGTIIMGIGFIVMPYVTFFDHSGHMPFTWIVLSYFLQTIGELLVSPIGLSMISELSPRTIIGLMMGAWYFATAFANAVASKVSELTTLPSGTNDPIMTEAYYTNVFTALSVSALLAGLIILLFSNKISHYINK